MVTISTKNPNATMAEDFGLRYWPSFMTAKVRSTCEPLHIPIGTQLNTNNTALTYTLTDVWQDYADGARNKSSSLLYQDNLLEKCSISNIDIDFDSQDRSTTQLAWSWWGAKVSVYTTCSINNSNGAPNGDTKLNLTMLYDHVPDKVRYGYRAAYESGMFLTRNAKTQASLYWSESLMSMSWATACHDLHTISTNATNDRIVHKGIVNFSSRPGGTTTSITDLDFFDVSYQFFELNWGPSPRYIHSPNRPFDIGSLNTEQQYPDIWIKTDVLAKAAYSTVLTDLGQVNAAYILLRDPAQLEHFTANFSDWSDHMVDARPGPTSQDYFSFGGSTGPLEIRPSVFVRDYLCQIPQRKSVPNLIVSVLVADLAFLKAVWQLYKLGVNRLLKTRVTDSQWCEGCRPSPEAVLLRSRSSEEDNG